MHEITAAIDVEEDFVEVNPDDDPDDEDGGEGEGVPVAEVVYEDVSVDAAVAGNLKLSDEMSTWEASVQNLPIDFVFNVDFLWNLGLRVSVPIYRPPDRPTARPTYRKTDRPPDRPPHRPTD